MARKVTLSKAADQLTLTLKRLVETIEAAPNSVVRTADVEASLAAAKTQLAQVEPFARVGFFIEPMRVREIKAEYEERFKPESMLHAFIDGARFAERVYGIGDTGAQEVPKGFLVGRLNDGVIDVVDGKVRLQSLMEAQGFCPMFVMGRGFGKVVLGEDRKAVAEINNETYELRAGSIGHIASGTQSGGNVEQQGEGR